MLDRAEQRRTNFFKGTKLAELPRRSDASVRLTSDAPGSGTIAEREKSELVERHLAALEATLPPNALSAGDRDKIRARAMLGSSSPSAILASVMQAVAEIKPALSRAAVDYSSSAAGTDAKSPDGVAGSGYRGGDSAFALAMYRRDLARERAGDGGIGGLTRVSPSGFGLGSDGNISGMSTQFYQQNFQSLYGASPQGQFTASRVAGILGRNEGLSGEALVARTKEVARDTRDRLGLDTNVYAPKVANVGKKYSDPIIENKKNLDEARAAQQRGDTAAAALHERRFLDERKRLEERARREDPTKAGDVAALHNGVIVEAMRNGWVPTNENAAEVFRSVIQSPDPDANKRLGEMLDAAKKTPEGAAMVDKLKPLIEQEQKAAAERAATAAQRREQESRVAAVDKKVEATNDDIDALVAGAADPAKQKAAAPVVEAPGKQAGAIPGNEPVKTDAPVSSLPKKAEAGPPADDKKSSVVAAAPPAKRPYGPTAGA